MLIEIPEPEIILGVILSFIVGLTGLFVFYKIRPFIKTNHNDDSLQTERLEYYERQLIDMKIRLDALELQGIETKPVDPNIELKQFLENLTKKQEQESVVYSAPQPENPKNIEKKVEEISNFDSNDVTEQVLHLITNKAMTSRDIQKALKRSREHISRFMKRLFEEGLVQRNTQTKPYTYSITEKGLQRIGLDQQNVVAS